MGRQQSNGLLTIFVCVNESSLPYFCSENNRLDHIKCLGYDFCLDALWHWGFCHLNIFVFAHFVFEVSSSSFILSSYITSEDNVSSLSSQYCPNQ